MKDLKIAVKHVANKMNLRKSKSEVHSRHQKLKKEYTESPENAVIYDSAEVNGGNFEDPFRTVVSLNPILKTELKTGLHKAVGGDHDYPNPGDILCAALATCFESTLRMIANRLEIELTRTNIKVSAMVDVRGTLKFDTSVPVGFQFMKMEVDIEAADISARMHKTLINAAKGSCVVYKTLKAGVPIKVIVK